MEKNKKRSIYFIGVGGIGMSALARLYKARGWNVAGSDATTSDLISRLRKEGIHVFIGHRHENIKPDVDLVVYNRAIHPDNPEILAAKKLGVSTLPYAGLLGTLTEEYITIAISGSHGKTT